MKYKRILSLCFAVNLLFSAVFALASCAGRRQGSDTVFALKHACGSYMLKAMGVGLDDVLPNGKTVQEVFDVLRQKGELVTPRVDSRGIPRVPFIRLAIKRNAKKPVFEYLLNYGADLTYISTKGEKKHLLWDAMTGPATFATLEILFSLELRSIIFPDGLAQVRALYKEYVAAIKCPGLLCKIRKTGQLIQAWEDEIESDSSLLISSEPQIKNEPVVGGEQLDMDIDSEEQVMDDDSEEDVCSDYQAVIEMDVDDQYALACAEIIAAEDQKVVDTAIKDTNLFFELGRGEFAKRFCQ